MKKAVAVIGILTLSIYTAWPLRTFAQDDLAAQKALLDQATEIVKNANSQSWTAGLVAFMFVLMFALWIVMVKWFQNAKSKADFDALIREQALGKKIDDVDEFTRTTLVELQTKSIEAMNNVAHAMRGCLARQGLDA